MSPRPLVRENDFADPRLNDQCRARSASTAGLESRSSFISAKSGAFQAGSLPFEGSPQDTQPALTRLGFAGGLAFHRGGDGASEERMERSHRIIDDPMQSDAAVLLAVRDALRSVYEDVLKQPIPRNVRALLSRLENESHLEPFAQFSRSPTASRRAKVPSTGPDLPATRAVFRRSEAEPCRPSR
jgi:hypothetical protein